LAKVECSEYIYDYYTWCGEGKHNNGEICNSGDGEYSQHIVLIGIKCSRGTIPTEEGSGSGESGGLGNNNQCSANGVYLNLKILQIQMPLHNLTQQIIKRILGM